MVLGYLYIQLMRIFRDLESYKWNIKVNANDYKIVFEEEKMK